MATKTGLQENVASLLCYVGWWVTGIVFLILEPENKTIKFHAIQSIALFGALFVIAIIFQFIPVFGWIIAWIAWIIGIIFWIILMVKAYNGERYKVPVVGDIADKNSQ